MKNSRKKSGGRKRKKRNRQILIVSYMFVAVFLAMMGYTCYYAITNQQELINNSYNGRQELLTAQNTRGSIYAAGGQILAETQIDAEGEEARVYPYENLFAHVWDMLPTASLALNLLTITI